MTRHHGRRWVLVAVWALAVVLIAALAQAAGLTVDGGATYTVNGTIYYLNEIVGYNGSGVINQSGFSNILSGNRLYPFSYLYLGYNPGSSGTYNLSGGILSVLGLINGAEFIGYHGVGTFNQSGGSNVARSIGVGSSSGATSTYNQSGGSVQTNHLGVGYGGVYNLSGGSISVYDDDLSVGAGGTFNQTGGSNTVDNYLDLQGAYNLSGGSIVAEAEFVGDTYGYGVFNQTGGYNQAEHIDVGWGGIGTYNLSSGSLKVSIAETIGWGGLVRLINPAATIRQATLLSVLARMTPMAPII